MSEVTGVVSKKRSVKFPCYLKREWGGRQRWCIFDRDGRIARVPTNFANHIQRQVPLKYAPGTVATYVSDLLSSLIWMRNILPVDEDISFDTLIKIADRTLVEDTLTDMLRVEGEVNPNTVQRREVVLRHLFEWCSTKKAGRIRTQHPYSENPKLSSRKQRSGGAQSDIDQFVNFETVGRILNSLHNECERVLVQTMFDVGARLGMTLSMTVDQLPVLTSEQRRVATLEDFHRVKSKDVYLPLKVYQSKKRSAEPVAKVVTITLPTMKRIEKYHRTPQYMKGIKALGFSLVDKKRPVFLTANGLMWSKRNALSQYRAAITRADLPDWLVLHSLRSGAAYLIIGAKDQGATVFDRLREAKKQLGHQHLATLEQHYLSLPTVLIQRFEHHAKESKWEVMLDLFEETYLAPKQNTEKRGRQPKA